VAQPTAAASSELTQLIEGAKKENELTLTLPSTATPATVGALEAAFNKTYGLNVKIKSAPSESYELTLARLLTEFQSGAKPSFDASVADEFGLAATQAAGATVQIKNWRALLPEGAPRDDSSISPTPVDGWGLKFTDNTHVLIYNPTLLSPAEVPTQLLDLAKPQFKARFSLPPFLSTLALLLLTQPQDKTLEIYRALGKNEPKIISYNDGVARLVLGELSVVPLPNEYDYFRRKRAGDPVALSVLRDFVPITPRYMVVRQNATSPNAAKLWVLFNAGPEAARIWYTNVNWLNTSYPNDDLRELQRILKEASATPVGWMQDERSLQQLRWVSTTSEGAAFQEALGVAIREGR
jgi:ABC-type Fe3+ transport system substrate-binding protein